MNKILEFLNSQCVQCILLTNNRLLFEFGGYEIIFVFEGEKSEFYEELRYKKLKSSDLEKLTEFSISECFVASSEYLGWRVDILDYNKPISICRKMYVFLRAVQEIDPSSILNYKLNQNEGYDEIAEAGYLCNLEPNYLFEIHLSEFFFSNSDFFEKLIEKLHLTNTDTDVTPPQFYWPFYKRYKKIEDSKRLSILNTNTKVRRLGYFKLLNNFFGKYKRVSANLLNKKFEKYVSEYAKELDSYKNNKGIIKTTKRGSSAKPYIVTAKSLKLLNLLNNVYSSGKLFKVYNVLKIDLSNNSKNPFYLDKLDKLFFFETILREDFLYISLLLELIMLKERTSYTQLVNEFQPLLLQRLNEYLDDLRIRQKTKSYKEIKKVIERVNKWKEVEVYLEHILMPRLSWLFDLELLVIDEKLNVQITKNGVRLFYNICYWSDINWTRVVSPSDFLDFFAIHTFDDVYSDVDKEYEKIDFTENQIRSNITYYLKQSFNYFQTIAPNRVTVSQAITYTKYKMYLVDNFKVEYSYITNYLESKKQNVFVYKFQKQYGDGYIQKIKK